MVYRTLIRFAAVKRVPLIKFRKGGNPPPTGGSAVASSNQASASSPAAAKKGSAAVIEDWQLPPRYWRKPIDPVEMEYINRGGPA